MTNPVSITAKGQNGTVTFDGDFVTIERTGFMARATVGKGTKRIPIATITAVQWKPAGLVNGFIAFTVAGGNEVRSRFGSQTRDAARDENSVVLTKKQEPGFEKLRAAVERAIAERHRPVPAAPVGSTDGGVLGQIEQLGKLRDAGVLTNDEFEAKKTELLRRL